LSNGTLWSNKSGSIKERTKMSGEMGTGCQRNRRRLRPSDDLSFISSFLYFLNLQLIQLPGDQNPVEVNCWFTVTGDGAMHFSSVVG